MLISHLIHRLEQRPAILAPDGEPSAKPSGSTADEMGNAIFASFPQSNSDGAGVQVEVADVEGGQLCTSETGAEHHHEQGSIAIPRRRWVFRAGGQERLEVGLWKSATPRAASSPRCRRSRPRGGKS
jgi:hypothetical protein